MKGLFLASVLAMVVTGCIVHRLTGPRLTGTCEGACNHYVACKPGHPEPDRARCRLECPQVFSDADSLMAYESLACPEAVEYVDGAAKKTASKRR
jgi:hypothetical protein